MILGITEFQTIHPIWWLFFSWLIWVLLRWRNWPRPSLSIMLMYSASIGIFLIRFWQSFNASLNNPNFDPILPIPFFLLPFLAAVSFWLIVLYIPISLTLKPKKLFDQKRYWWITFLVLSLAAWHLLSEVSYSTIRALVYLFQNITYSDLISTNIYFYPAMGLLIPLLIWLFLRVSEHSRPALPTISLYLISLVNASTMLWIEASACKAVINPSRNLCEVNFSLPLFLGEIALWFISLYAIVRLISRIELGNKLFGIPKKHEDQSIGID